ncbi:ubiquitin carboxyl-terminal hydrolase 16-like isoform X2 [Uloborus diversus]|uniref:ubiquitin carboxyl-terminal hydrolase 16-like isoform X2 n=1 Tax=Uloborus diversus TaxID=327109 RepID=UPI00240A252C|nr:ubiquitin carboxyl-terminal hydrolase 16-like isoform X2 [Uloborus diversus]
MPKKKNSRQKHQKDVSFAETSEEELNSGNVQINGKVCSHLSRGINFGRIKKTLKTGSNLALCNTCDTPISDPDNAAEVWLCIQCGYRGCGRMSENKHALQHYKTIHSDCHALVLSTSSGIVWCYDCDNDIPLQSSSNLKQCVEFVMKLRSCNKVEADKVSEASNSAIKKESDLMNSESCSKSSNEELKDSKKKNTDIVKKEAAVHKKTVKGLRNLGNTCFFNAVMQNLSQTHLLFHELEQCCSPTYLWEVPKLVCTDDGIVEDTDSSHMKLSLPRQFSLVNSLLNFLKQMYAPVVSKVEVINPNTLFGEIQKRSPQYSHFQEQDSHELLRQLLDGVRQEEIKRQRKALLKVFNLENVPPDEVDKSTKKLFKEYGRYAGHTIVERIFGGLLVSTVLCEECNAVSQVVEPFMDLSLPLFEEKPSRGRKSEIDADETIAEEYVLNKPKSDPEKPSKYQERKMKQLAKKEKKKGKNVKNKRNSDSGIATISDETKNASENASNEETNTCHDLLYEESEKFDKTDGILINPENGEPAMQSPLANVSEAGSESSLKETDEEDPVEKNKTDDKKNDGTCEKTEKPVSKEVGFGKDGKSSVSDKKNSGDKDKVNSEEKFENFHEKVNGEAPEKKCCGEDEVETIQEGPSDCLEKADVENSEKIQRQHSASNGKPDNELISKFSMLLNEEKTEELRNSPDQVINNSKNDNESEEDTFVKDNNNSSDKDLKADTQIPAIEVSSNQCPNGSLEISQECDDSLNISNLDERMQVLSMQAKEVRIRHDSDKQDDILNSSETVCDAGNGPVNCNSHKTIEKHLDSNGNTENWSHTLTENETKDWLQKSLSTLKPRSHFSPNECSINSCLNHFTKPELLTGSNKFRCENCTKIKCDKTGNAKEVVYANASKQLLIFSPPAILTLHLKRFQQVGMNLRKNNKFVEFPLLLNLAPFCSSACLVLPHMANVQDEILYSLYGLVEHSGRLTSGHYTAYIKANQRTCKSLTKAFENHCPLAQCDFKILLHKLYQFKSSICEPPESIDNSEDSKWYYISDSHVKEVTESSVLNSQAYLLFYERIK